MKYLYLLESDGYFKIGTAEDVSGRIAQLQTGNPHAIDLVVSYRFENADVVERSLHQKFFTSRWRNEWFKLNPKDIEELQSICILLGGELFIGNSSITENEVEEAEQLQEEIFDGNARPEFRRDTSGEIYGIAFRERNKGRKLIGYIGKRDGRFAEILEKIVGTE